MCERETCIFCQIWIEWSSRDGREGVSVPSVALCPFHFSHKYPVPIFAFWIKTAKRNREAAPGQSAGRIWARLFVFLSSDDPLPHPLLFVDLQTNSRLELLDTKITVSPSLNTCFWMYFEVPSGHKGRIHGVRYLFFEQAILFSNKQVTFQNF